MKKGLTTLMTVAIALVSVQALAMAPVIHDLPSVVVGNQASVSQPVKYVYIDAFDLNNFVYDDNTSTPQLKWSYEIGGTPKYTVNGVAIMNSGVDDPANPPANKILAGPGAVTNTFTNANSTGYTGLDALPNTVTIRNIALNPYPAGPPNSDQSAANQAWAPHSQAVTFWCSDGNLASSSTVLFWTDNHYNNSLPIGVQKLSGTAQWTTLKQDFLNGTGSGNGLWKTFDPFFDHTTSHTINGSGICFAVTATGQNWGSVQSPMPYFTLTANTVYKIRATMNGSQTSWGKTPLWDFIVENLSKEGVGLNLYGMDSFYMDNEGGANTILSTTNGTEMLMYWAPTAFTTPQWTNSTTGLWAMDTTKTPPVPKYEGRRDPCLRFRVMDVDAAVGLKNDQKFGDICLQKVVVEAIGYGACQIEQANIVSIGGLLNAPKAASNTVAGGNMICAGLTGSTATYTATSGSTPGWVTLTPTSSVSQQNELMEIAPATDLRNTFPTNEILDNWPIPWQTGKIYRLRVAVTAPNSLSASSPWDVMFLSIESPTYEIGTESFTSANNAIGSPKTGAPQTYTMFYYSGQETKSLTANLHFLRWRVRLGNSTNLNWPAPSNLTNTGSLNLYDVTVDTVKFQ